MSKKSNATYYLPEEIQKWIEEKAQGENRSPSNYLSTLLLRQIEQEAANANH
ncbi:hypothetical protein [Tautonia plasticadhaerens]|uniref:CopG-like ribbon-helix-helix domain-containing protein n=1 Tax=Tautonia plasticadhaerens TaxID=2527974 RepID=A0A518H263_9BACT|nr:hypothetical protein [Tautonia plasticadhaerens]QDV34931.1 hypothetical protein ElP_28280 [Tautonia plasticadhaerens]